MKYIIKAIHDFFEPLDNVYVNPHKIVFSLMIDEICMSVPWPGFKHKNNIALEIVYNSGTISHFIKEMAITTGKDLDTITPATLMDLYIRGKASVFCLIYQNRGYSFHFRRQNDKIITTDDHNLTHNVYGGLKTPEEFINYVENHSQHKQKVREKELTR